MPTVLVQGHLTVNQADRLRRLAGNSWTVLDWDPARDDLKKFEALAFDADVIVGGEVPLTPWPAVPKLKLYQIPWTGYDFCTADDMPLGLPVCNTYEHETAIAEYTLLSMLEWQIGLSRMDRDFRHGGWGQRWTRDYGFHGEIRGKTVGIIGFGHIGREIAKRAKAFGMRVVGIRRRNQPTPQDLDWLGTNDDLDRLLAESDFAVVCCDLNEETRGLIDRARLSNMKSTGVMINVARGEVIDEGALYDALKSKSIGGAVLDVWYNYGDGPEGERPESEPWPTDFPFQNLSNTILSAHESSWTLEQVERRWHFILSNMNRAISGEPLQNVVFMGTQAPMEPLSE